MPLRFAAHAGASAPGLPRDSALLTATSRIAVAVWLDDERFARLDDRRVLAAPSPIVSW
jgi:hypothetical protein